MDEYYCPNCGATLNDQYGFDPELGHFTCEVCGTELYDESVEETMGRFDGVVWYCDNCGACLNMQDGFSDYGDYWYCSECGHKNPINENEIYESREDYESARYSFDYESEEPEESEESEYDSYSYDDDSTYESDEDEDSSEEYTEYDGDYVDETAVGSLKSVPSTSSVDSRRYMQNNSRTYSSTTVNNTHIHEAPAPPKNKYDVEIEKIHESERAKDKKHRLIRFIIAAILLLLGVIALVVFWHSFSVNQENNYSNYIATLQGYIAEEKYEEAEKLISHAQLDEWPYVNQENWPREKENYLVEIEEKRAQSTGIPIKTIGIPRSSSDYKRMNYEDVVHELIDTGFIRVHYAETGNKSNMFHRANTVQRVSIDGETEFDEGDQYSKVAKIVVYYYAEN